jgi:hypothetical protein
MLRQRSLCFLKEKPQHFPPLAGRALKIAEDRKPAPFTGPSRREPGGSNDRVKGAAPHPARLVAA